MRFLALLRKELRESLPWLLLAGLLLLAVGLLVLGGAARFSEWRYWQSNPGMAPGETVNTWRLLRPTKLELPGIWLAFIAPSLGLILAVRQFWFPLFTRTWSFLLHRSVRRTTILGAKLVTAAIFLVVVGLIWTGLYWYACRPDRFPLPEPPQMLLNGWIYVALGLLVYLGAALSALSEARWYTTRIFGLAFAVVALFVILCQWRLIWVAVLMVLALAVVLIQTLAAFLSREF